MSSNITSKKNVRKTTNIAKKSKDIIEQENIISTDNNIANNNIEVQSSIVSNVNNVDNTVVNVLENDKVVEDKEVEGDSDFNDDGSMKTKRRGRKPKDKFKYENTDLEEYHKNNRKEENVIIKLPLSCLKLNEEFTMGKDLFPYNPVISTPKPYNPEHKGNIGYSLLENVDIDGNDGNDCNNSNNYENIQKNAYILNDGKSVCEKCINCECNKQRVLDSSNSIIQNDKQLETRQIDIILNNKYNSNTDKFNVLTHLGICLTGNKWIEKTDVPCLWCCHQFNNNPWGIPFKFVNDKFQLFGNFCTPNCTLAYILQNYKEDDYLWEKIALLNLLLYKVSGQYKTIKPAFDKMALKMFGGTLEIDEYRSIIMDNEKSYSIEFPPCNTIIPMLEEIYKKTNLNNTFIPVDKTRIQVANNELKLKRSKPVVNHKNTLDFCLGKVIL
jgi:thiol-disulfide isomerase/thioredoxin